MGTGPHRGPCPVTAGSGAGMLPLGVQLAKLSLTWRDPAGGREFGRFKPSGPWAADR